MTRFGILAATVGGMVMALSSCGDQGRKTVEVDGHVFQIPKEYLIPGAIPWLPVSQSEGVKFIINPDDQSEEQMIVTIESQAKTCHPQTPPATNQLASACEAAARKDVNVELGNKIQVEKVNGINDPTQWSYRVKGQGNTGTIIASCYALSEDGALGLCTALGNYSDLVYSIGMRDKDVGNMTAIHKKVNNLLRSWDVKSGVN